MNWDWMKHLLEWFKTSPRYLFPIAVSTAFILFAPESIIETIGVLAIRIYGQPYLGLIFLVSTAIVVCDIFIKIISHFDSWYHNFIMLSGCKSRLHHLTTEEKKVLRGYLEKETRTQTFNIENRVVSGLVAANILYPAVKVADVFAFPININFPVWKYLSSHPELVNVSSKK